MRELIQRVRLWCRSHPNRASVIALVFFAASWLPKVVSWVGWVDDAMTTWQWLLAVVGTVGPWIIALVGLAVVVFAHWPAIRGRLALTPEQVAEKKYAERQKKLDDWFREEAQLDRIERRNAFQRGMYWLIDWAESNPDAYTIEDANSWLRSAFSQLDRLNRSPRNSFGCTSNPSFRDFRQAVARFRAIADDLRPEDMPD